MHAFHLNPEHSNDFLGRYLRNIFALQAIRLEELTKTNVLNVTVF
jgi:hypothetical protein